MCFLPGRPRFSSQSIVFRTVRSRKWITIKKAYNHINQIDGPHLIQRPTGVKKRKWFYNWKRWRFIIGAQLLAWLISLQAQNAMTKNASLWIVQSLITFFPKKIRTFFLKWCRKFSQPTSIFNVINSYPWSFPFCQFVYNGNPFCLVFRFSANETLCRGTFPENSMNYRLPICYLLFAISRHSFKTSLPITCISWSTLHSCYRFYFF